MVEQLRCQSALVEANCLEHKYPLHCQTCNLNLEALPKLPHCCQSNDFFRTNAMDLANDAENFTVPNAQVLEKPQTTSVVPQAAKNTFEKFPTILTTTVSKNWLYSDLAGSIFCGSAKNQV